MIKKYNKYFYKIHVQMTDFKNYFEAMENLICSNIVSMEQEMISLPEADNEEYWDVNRYPFIAFTKTFPLSFSYSHFINCYIVLETELNNLCKTLQYELELDISSSELKGNVFERSQKYFKKIAKVNFPDQTREWELINKFNRIRNCIVHNNGYTNGLSNEQNLLKDIETTQYIKLDDNRIELSYPFCLEVIEIIYSFFNILTDEIENVLSTK